jgi:diguanylate cyclase (GGDEF)-like protein
MHVDKIEGVARMAGHDDPMRIASDWLGLEEQELVAVPQRVLVAISDRLRDGGPERPLQDELLLRLQDSIIQLRTLAGTDALTRLSNRRTLESRLTEEVARAQRHGRPLALLFVDVDQLKDVNDSAGHGAGDALLREIAARLQASVRMSDLVGRWGGDEFLVICPETGAAAAERLACKLRVAVGDRPVQLASGTRRVRVSIGTAAIDRDGDAGDLLSAADSALYEEKRRRTTRGSQRPLVHVLH